MFNFRCSSSPLCGWNQGECAGAEKAVDRVPLCKAQRFYRNTPAWLCCTDARMTHQSYDIHIPTIFASLCPSVSHANKLLPGLLFSSFPPWNQQMKSLTCLWYLPSFVKSQVLCLVFSLPLSLFFDPSLSPFLCFSPSLTLPPPSLSLGRRACLLGLFPGSFPFQGHSGFFLLPGSAQGQRDWILIPTGRQFSCVWTLSQFVVTLFRHIIVKKVVTWACLHTCEDAKTCAVYKRWTSDSLWTIDLCSGKPSWNCIFHPIRSCLDCCTQILSCAFH